LGFLCSFSVAAKAKAALNRIDLLTPQEVESVDWPTRFQKLGVATVVGQLKIEHFQFTTTPPLPGAIDLQRDRIRREVDGQRADGTVREFVEALGPHIIESAQRHQKEKFLTIYQTRADLEKIAIMDLPVPTPNLWLVSEGSPYRIDALNVRVSIKQQVTNVPVKHSRLGEDAMVTSANFDGVAMAVAQAANADGGKVFLERAANKKTTKVKSGRTRGSRATQPRKRVKRP